MSDFSFTGIYTEYDGKEGVLMGNKHIFANGKGIIASDTQNNCGSYYFLDNFCSNSKIAALSESGYLLKIS